MKKQLFALTIFVLILVLVSQNRATFDSDPYIHGQTAATAPVDSEKSSLYDQLEQAAETFNEPPIDAVVDKVWKAIPGYNGKVVDMKASYEAMEKSREFDKNKLIFKEIPPEVHLKDLPPAPLYKGNPAKPMASFLINVSWGEEHLPKMLKILREEKVKATFFLEGKWVQKNPKLANMILEEGHEVGNHAYSHPDMSTISKGRITQEIKQTNETIEAVLSVKPTLFAPPSGSYNEEVVRIADRMNMTTILWTIDTIDWKDPDPYQMADRTASKVENGSLILMHPTDSAVTGLKSMIQQIKEKNIQLNTVSRLLDESRLD
ncbi:polysaccharide deacetylase family protein [Bacillus piscicola]|uniref:polysaccharide deacetylase family protein n=1 Tax=Bacillus piscicola TaxID=1632684 RepID=UPI001F0889CA|nr:polysaccharide deacetylase family protein [Bacillus piscicola]